MSEIGDDFKFLEDLRRKERDEALPGRREELWNLGKEGYRVEAFGAPFDQAIHFRVGNGTHQIDIWPSRNRYAYVVSRYLHAGPRDRGTIYEPKTITDFIHEKLPLKAEFDPKEPKTARSIP